MKSKFIMSGNCTPDKSTQQRGPGARIDFLSIHQLPQLQKGLHPGNTIPLKMFFHNGWIFIEMIFKGCL